MIIQYFSAEGKLVNEDLSSKKIECWGNTTKLGYLPHGSLCINYLPKGGIYPPVKNIKNYSVVLSYLKKFPQTNNP